MGLTVVPFNKSYDRTRFASTDDSLNHYLQFQVSQDVRKKVSACFVLIDDQGAVMGYYTLSSDGIPKKLVPEKIVKSLPYPVLPVTLLGRLAVDKSLKGQGWGPTLLVHAMKKSLQASTEVGSVAMVVDPTSDKAASFYAKYKFIPLIDSKRMFLPLKTIAQAF